MENHQSVLYVQQTIQSLSIFLPANRLCSCRVADYEALFGHKVHTKLNKIGLCLECVVQGRIFQAEGNCGSKNICKHFPVSRAYAVPFSLPSRQHLLNMPQKHMTLSAWAPDPPGT